MKDAQISEKGFDSDVWGKCWKEIPIRDVFKSLDSTK